MNTFPDLGKSFARLKCQMDLQSIQGIDALSCGLREYAANNMKEAVQWVVDQSNLLPHRVDEVIGEDLRKRIIENFPEIKPGEAYLKPLAL